MDFSKKVRFSLERLDVREVPAQLVELPAVAAPQAEVAVTAPVEVGQDMVSLKVKFTDVIVSADPENASPSVKTDAAGLNYSKIEYGLNYSKIEYGIKIDSVPSADPSDAESAGKVQMQDFHFTRTVDKHSPILR